MQTAAVTIGRFTLKLSPLKRKDLPGARRAFHALAVAQLAPVASNPWLKAYSDAAGFLFLAAQGNHRGLRLDDLDDAEPEEVVSAFKALAELMRGRYGRVWEAPGNGSGDSPAKGCAENRA
jgi:hypothetical protein